MKRQTFCLAQKFYGQYVRLFVDRMSNGKKEYSVTIHLPDDPYDLIYWADNREDAFKKYEETIKRLDLNQAPPEGFEEG